LRNLTESRVFWISGIFSLRPPIRFCKFISMNWYLLPRHTGSALHRASFQGLMLPPRSIGNSRYHFLEAAKRRLDIVSCGNIVLDLIDERGIGDAPRIGRCSIFTIWCQFLLIFLAYWEVNKLFLGLTLSPFLFLLTPSCRCCTFKNKVRYLLS
jgi:hypothetical protein